MLKGGLTVSELKQMKKHEQMNNAPDRVKSSQRETYINCKYCGNVHEPWRAQNMLRDSPYVGRKINLRKYTGARADFRDDKRCRTCHHICQVNENTEVATQEFDKVR